MDQTLMQLTRVRPAGLGPLCGRDIISFSEGAEIFIFLKKEVHMLITLDYLVLESAHKCTVKSQPHIGVYSGKTLA